MISQSYFDCSTSTCATIPTPDTSFICVIGYVAGCAAGKVPLADGSSALYKNGQLIGYANKRIYTVEEAVAVSKDTGNTIKLRYK